MTRPRGARGRGGKHGHEPRGRIRLREERALQMHLEGHSQYEIARALQVSQAAVSKILKRIDTRVLADMAWRADRQRARQSLRLEYIYAESMKAWRASQEDGLRRRQRKTEAAGGATAATVAELTSEQRNGDPRFLDEARRALSDLRSMWGIDAPERLSVEATNRFASMTDDVLEQELSRQGQFLARFAPAPITVNLSKGKSGAYDQAD